MLSNMTIENKERKGKGKGKVQVMGPAPGTTRMMTAAEYGRQDKIRYDPVRNWGGSGVVIEGERQFMLEGCTEWQGFGRLKELSGEKALEEARGRGFKAAE